MFKSIFNIKKTSNGKNGEKFSNGSDHELMHKILNNSIKLMDLSPLIRKESENLKNGTDKIDQALILLSDEMNSVQKVVDQVSNFANENVRHVLKVKQNLDLTKQSFSETEASMLSIKDAVENLVTTTSNVTDAIQIISSLASTIKEIADKTQLLSLNASIEAAHAGVHGRGFAIVAEEVGKLANMTMETTKDMSLKAKNIFSLIEKIKEETKIIKEEVQKTQLHVIENKEKILDVDIPLNELAQNAENLENVSNTLKETINKVENSINMLSDYGKNAISSSNNLKLFSENLHTLSEEQILYAGRVRIKIHEYAKEVVEKAASSYELKSMHRFTVEKYLRDLISKNDIFELLYVTDNEGIQIIDNIGKEDFTAEYGSTGYGKNWSMRQWFTEVRYTLKTYISDIYISVATNSYCFTVSAPIFDQKGEFKGVLGADVDLRKVIEFI
ncbi:MAG: methyl-accepting chemotaxis protein [Thermodesulfovibrio sp.]|nr:methyl-accepting chemotaxis protein [Thermodesulfovibrio sp.]MDW7999339.1 methyl-accepting chemotaxis protein [Thermodesulfovibrio sp.]